MCLVRCVNASALFGADKCGILSGDTKYRRILCDVCAAVYRHRIREDITCISAVRSEQLRRGSDLLVVVRRIYDQDRVLAHVAVLTVIGDRQHGENVAQCNRAEFGDCDRLFFRIYAADHVNVRTHLTIHANRFILTGSADDTIFKAVCNGLIEHLTHIAVKPFGTQVQHCLADRQESGQLAKRGIYDAETRSQLLDDIGAERTPDCTLRAVDVGDPAHCAACRDEVDTGQQRMIRAKVVKDGLDYGFRHGVCNAGQCLFRIACLHGFQHLAEILVFLARQLAYAPALEDALVHFFAHIVKLAVVLCSDALADVFQHRVKCLVKSVFVLRLDCSLELFAQFRALFQKIL